MNTSEITKKAIELAKIMKEMEKLKPGSPEWIKLSAQAARLMN